MRKNILTSVLTIIFASSFFIALCGTHLGQAYAQEALAETADIETETIEEEIGGGVIIPAETAKKPANETAALDEAQLNNDADRESLLEFLKNEVDRLLETERKRGIFGRDKDGLSETLIRETNHYYQIYRDTDKADEALYLCSRILRHRQEHEAEAKYLFKLIYEYPESGIRPEAEKRIFALAADELKKDKDTFAEAIKGPSGGDAPDRWAEMLKKLSRLSNAKYADSLREEYDEFIRHYPSHKSSDLILTLAGNNYLMAKDYESAAYVLRRLVLLYPSSPLRAISLHTLGRIYETNLKEYGRSVIAYRQVFTEYPNSPEAVSSYENAANIFEKELNDYEQAAYTLSAFTSKHPDAQTNFASLKKLASLLSARLGRHEDAVEVYGKIADTYKGVDAVEALNSAADIANAMIKDYVLKVGLLKRIAVEYPDRPEAPEALFKIAETYEGKLEEPAKADEIYKAIIEKYPSDRFAKKAESILKKSKR